MQAGRQGYGWVLDAVARRGCWFYRLWIGVSADETGAGPWRLAAAAVLLVVVAGAGAGVLLSGDDGGEVGPAPVRVLLEPVGASTPDGFGPDFDAGQPGRAIAIALPRLPPLEDGIASTLSARRASGDVPGLFGGSRDASVCDLAALVAFLTDPANAAKAQAWARVLDIAVDDIAGYIDDLTAVRLRFDTRVTNHGFADGEARPIQSILQAGTAVLVDGSGAPRVKCSCGNPLLEPAPIPDGAADAALDPDALASNAADAWPGFDPALAVTVEPAAEMDELALLDVETGEFFARPVGSNGDQDGDVDDLDEKCRLVPESRSCAEGPDLLAFCTTFQETLRGGPSLEISASSDADSAEVTFENADEVLAYLAERVDELGRLPRLAPEELRDDVQVYVDAVRRGVETGDVNLLFPPLDVLERIDTFVTASC